MRLRSRPHSALLGAVPRRAGGQAGTCTGRPPAPPRAQVVSDPEVGNAAMAILAELWAARNKALTAKMAELVPDPARGTLLAYFPESRRRWRPN